MNTGIISLLLIIANVAVSYRGLTSPGFFERYEFSVERLLVYRDYKRLVTSGFLHVSWRHLFFNMLSLYFFSGSAELFLGPVGFLLVYFASLIGGNLFSLFVHRHDSSYSSVGASGAVCGLIFASIALAPGMRIGLFFLPIYLPAWIYGVAFVLYSIYGIRSRKNNIGHEAHLAGALVGMGLALLLHPEALAGNLLTIGAVALPAIAFIYVIITRPHALLVDNLFYKSEQKTYSIDHRYNAEKRDRQAELDRILEKIHKHGMASLSKSERELLERYSR